MIFDIPSKFQFKLILLKNIVIIIFDIFVVKNELLTYYDLVLIFQAFLLICSFFIGIYKRKKQ